MATLKVHVTKAEDEANKMVEMCKEKKKFVCRYDTYQFEVMHLGSMNYGATCQRMMDNILANVSNVM